MSVVESNQHVELSSQQNRLPLMDSHTLISPEKEEFFTPSLVTKPHLIFFDLDNTLIPTTWMLKQWEAYGLHQGNSRINSELNRCGLFELLDHFFGLLTHHSCCRSVIVTNAGIETVQATYLKHCLPELKTLIQKYSVALHSTQNWVSICGSAPSGMDFKLFQEYYTNVKFLQFEKELIDFTNILESSWSTRPNVDVISVGDQLCEIVAAVRLAKAHPQWVHHAKLVLVADRNLSKSPDVTPPQFIANLKLILNTVFELLDNNVFSTKHPIPRTIFGDSMMSSNAQLFPVHNLWAPRMNLECSKRKRLGKDKLFYKPAGMARRGIFYSRGKKVNKKYPANTSSKENQEQETENVFASTCDSPDLDSDSNQSNESSLVWITKTDTLAFCIGTADEFGNVFFDPSRTKPLMSSFYEGLPVAAILSPHDKAVKRQSTESNVSFHGLLKVVSDDRSNVTSDCDLESSSFRSVLSEAHDSDVEHMIPLSQETNQI